MKLFPERSWAAIFVFIWFALYAIFGLTTIGVTFTGSGVLLAVVAAAAAVCIAFGK